MENENSAQMARLRQQVNREARTAEKGVRTQLIQLLICLVFFAALLLCKTFWPKGTQSVQAFIADHVAAGIDVKQAVGALGQAFTGKITFAEAFQNIGGGAEQASTTTDGRQDAVEPPENTRTDDWLTPAVSYPGVTEQIERLFTPQDYEPLLANTPLPLISELTYHIAPVELEDDTWPLPFNMTKPDIVDFTAYSIAFAYTDPVYAPVTSAFGYRTHPIDGENKFHYGIDLGAPYGSAIRAFADGTVSETGRNDIYGNYVRLTHEGGFASFYAHCKSILVDKGDSVQAGDTIALVGDTGAVTGPHLHFELRHDGKIIDPTRYLTLPEAKSA